MNRGAGYVLGSLAAFLAATLIAEWATRKVWPEDYASQKKR